MGSARTRKHKQADEMRRVRLFVSLWLVSGALLPARVGLPQQADDVVVSLESYEGPARVVGQAIERHKLQVAVDPKSESRELLIRVKLPNTGRDAWPAADVEVRNARGQAILVRRSGIEWHKLLIPVPALRSTYIVQAVGSPLGSPRSTKEKERQFSDQATGLSVSLARWYDGRQAALSLRFDDSHPTHLTKAIPILREYGFRGTFMINPGPAEPGSRRRSDFEMHRAEWEAVARSGAHEFANHTAHHRGATSDDDMDAEIGDAARAIWRLTPGRSKLMALNLGGGTQWTTSRTLRHYLDKYHHFDASGGSLGMDDTYGNRVNAFREHVERHLESRGWCRAHYHYIGEGMSSSEANFRAALDVVKEHEASLWIAGLADIYKYQVESNTASLSLVESTDHRLVFRLSCQTDPELYDQPLTMEVTVPKSWPPARIGVRNSQDEAIGVRGTNSTVQEVLRFDVAPRTACYIIELNR
jgi:hypothetical protein